MAAYPEVGEAVIWLVTGAGGVCEDDETWWSRLSEEDRERLNRRRAVQRAATKMRRYAVRNKLVRLLTLTYRCVVCDGDPCTCGQRLGPAERSRVKRDVNRLMVAMRDSLGVEALPYLYVIERGGKRTKRLHIHLLVGSEVDVEALGELRRDGRGEEYRTGGVWVHGRVHVREPSGAGLRDRARSGARYLAKYVDKALGDEDEAWAHSYERSQGFNVRQVGRHGLLRLGDAVEVVAMVLGVAVADLEWSWSDDWEDWFGPPTAAVRLA